MFRLPAHPLISSLYVCSGGEVVGPGVRLPGPATCLAWAPGLLAVGGADVALWDLATAALLWRRAVGGPVTSLAISGEVYAAAAGQVHVFTAAGAARPAVAGELVAAGGGAVVAAGRKVRVRRAGAWQVLARAPGPVTAVAVSARGTALACGRHITVWEEGGERPAEYTAGGAVSALVLGPALLALHPTGATLLDAGVAREYSGWAGCFTGPRALLLATGSTARPHLTHLFLDAEAAPAAAAAVVEPRRKRQRVAATLPGLEVAGSEPGVTLEQQLAVLAPGLGPGPGALVSVTAALRQALHSGDARLLENCLALSDPGLVTASVRQLEAQHLLQLLTVLTTTLQLSPKYLSSLILSRALQLLPWLTALLVHHAAYLLSVPQAKPLLSQLHQCIDQRLAPFRKLLKLNGRLTLLLSQLRPASSLDLGEPAVFDENESSEEEEEEPKESDADSDEF